MNQLEHVNVTVADPDVTAAVLIDIFGWKVRWKGTALNDGLTVHVGSDESYVALYTGPDRGKDQRKADNSYLTRGGLNHIGIVVDDLDVIEAKVVAKGYEPHSHADYEPGKRFYFYEENGVEIEVICYA